MGLSRPVRLSATALASAGLVTTGIGFPTSQLAHAEGRTVMATTAVNVRSGPGTSYKILGVLYPGHTAQQIGNTRYGWAQVTWKGHTAYVAAQYLRGSSAAGSSSTHVTLRPSPGVPKAAPVSGSVVRPVVGQKRSTAVLMVRSSYTNHFGSEGDAPIGTIFNVTGRTANGLAEVIWQGRPRWVNAKYLTPVGSPKPKPSKPRTPAKPARPTTPAKPKPSTPATPKVIGVRYATTALDIRTASGSSSRTVGEVTTGTALSITGVTANGRSQIVYRGQTRWVTSKWLSANKPGTTKPAASKKTKSGKTSTPSSPGNWNKLMAGGSEGLSGLRPSAKGLVNNVLQNFPQINTIYGVRPHDPYPDHPSGHAIDLMLPNYKSNEALGWKMAKYYQAHASELGVSYIIFHQQIWSVARDSEGWRHMEDRGGDTANHMDHVHITTIWD